MSDARDKALATDRDEWSVDHDAEPGIAGNAFKRGWDAGRAVSLPDRETLTQEERHEMVDAAVKEMTPNFTNGAAAWNAWNNLNTSPAFIAAFQHFHPTARGDQSSPAPLTINREAVYKIYNRAYDIEFRESGKAGSHCVKAGIDAVIAHLSAQTVEGEGLQSQVNRLAAFIVDEVHGEPSQPEGAIDTAIRIIREQQAVEAENHRAYLWVQGIVPADAKPNASEADRVTYRREFLGEWPAPVPPTENGENAHE